MIAWPSHCEKAQQWSLCQHWICSYTISTNQHKSKHQVELILQVKQIGNFNIQFKQTNPYNRKPTFPKELVSNILKQQNDYVVLSQKRTPPGVFYSTKYILKHWHLKLSLRIKAAGISPADPSSIPLESSTAKVWASP